MTAVERAAGAGDLSIGPYDRNGVRVLRCGDLIATETKAPMGEKPSYTLRVEGREPETFRYSYQAHARLREIAEEAR